MSTHTTARRAPQITLDRIEIGGNVRELDPVHVSALAGSMAVRGLIVPVAVRPLDGERFALVAGEHRLAAARELGWSTIAAVIGDQAEGTSGDQGAENVLRKTLTPLEGGRGGREDARRRLQRRRRRDRARLAQAQGDRAPADPRAARGRADAGGQRRDLGLRDRRAAGDPGRLPGAGRAGRRSTTPTSSRCRTVSAAGRCCRARTATWRARRSRRRPSRRCRPVTASWPAIEREARSYRGRVAALEQHSRAATAMADDVGEEPDVEPVGDVDGELCDEDLAEQQAA